MVSVVAGSILEGAGAGFLTRIAVGVAAGLADQQIGRAIFGGSQSEPSFGGLNLTTSNEGDPIATLHGGVFPETFGELGHRMAGAVVWKSDVYQLGNSGSTKRGTPASATNYVDVCYEFAGNWCGGFDFLLANGEVVFDNTAPPLEVFDFNQSGATINDPGGTDDIYLDYVSRQSFSTFGDPPNNNLAWFLIVRTRRGVDGTPQDSSGSSETPAAERLRRFRRGDLINLRLPNEAGTYDARQSHRLGSTNTLEGYRCVDVIRHPDGNVEVHLALTVTGNQGYVGGIGPNVDGWVAGNSNIPLGDYPVWPSNLLATSQLEMQVVREPWADGFLLASTPTLGIDWEYRRGEDGGQATDQEDQIGTDPPSIISDSTYGGLGDDAPYGAQSARLYLRGVNLSKTGNQVPNLEAVLREGQNLWPAHLMLTLCHKAGISPKTARMVNDHFVGGAYGTMTAPTGYGTAIDRPTEGAHHFQLLDLGLLRNSVNEGDLIYFKESGVAPDPDTDIPYRIRGIKTNGLGNYVRVWVEPRLNEDHQGDFAHFYRWKANASGTIQYKSVGVQNTADEAVTVSLFGDLELRETSGKLEIFDASQRDELEVTVRHLQARQFGEDPGPAIELEDDSDRDIPNRINVLFSNRENRALNGLRDDFRDGIRIDDIRDGSVTLPTAPNSQDDPNVIDLRSINMTTTQAQSIARRIMRRARSERFHGSRIRLPSWYLHVQEGDRLGLGQISALDAFLEQSSRILGREIELIVDRVDIGTNDTVELLVRVIDVAADIPPTVVASPPQGGLRRDDCGFDTLVSEGGPIAAFPINGPFGDSFTSTPGYFVIAAATGNICTQNRVATIFQSNDGGETFAPVEQVVANGTVGNTLAPTTAFSAGFRVQPGQFENASEVSVYIPAGELVSATREQVEEGENFALIGKELVCFQDARQDSMGTHETADGETSFEYTDALKIADGTDGLGELPVRVRRKSTKTSPSEWRYLTSSIGSASTSPRGEAEF
jgi:hypothetical protein